jgi:polysaccharide export outer membrane protein
MTVMQAISVGGGLTVRGTERGIRVNRHLPAGKVEALQTATTDLVRENDVIFIKESLF